MVMETRFSVVFGNVLYSLLSHAHLTHALERDKPAEVAVMHQPKLSVPSANGLLGPA
jgi:hypothetical protein